MHWQRFAYGKYIQTQNVFFLFTVGEQRDNRLQSYLDNFSRQDVLAFLLLSSSFYTEYKTNWLSLTLVAFECDKVL